MLLVLVLYAAFASVFTVAKVGLAYTTPLFLVGSRMWIAGLAMIGYAWIRGKNPLNISFRGWVLLGALGFFNIYLTNFMEFWSLQYLTTFKTCFIYSLSPFLAAIFSYFLFSESLTQRKWIGLFCGFLGFIPILLQQTPAEELSGQFGFFSWAECAMIVAAASSTYGWILLRQCVKEESLPPFIANGWSMCFGGGLALIHSFFTENWNPVPVTETIPFLEATLLLIILSNLIAYNLYGYLLKRFTATFLSLAGFSTPIFTALFGWLILGETVTTVFTTSAAIVFCSLFVFYQEELRIQGVVNQKAIQPEGA